MSHKSSMHGGGESSDCIVPAKCANKGGEPSAERMEGRRSAKEILEYWADAGHRARQYRQLQYVGSVSWNGPGVPFSKVGTVCVRSASTGLCGGQRATAVPTAPRRPFGRRWKRRVKKTPPPFFLLPKRSLGPFSEPDSDSA